MARRRKAEGSYEISGPNVEDRFAPNATAAISTAQTFACAWSKPGTWYVRLLGKPLWHIERTEAGVVITRPA